ncbi:hypothetical protein HPP92_000595 [Vanilla planifolia]|uniref:Uncharacterized protein n=1 Tax=Vanilla planifolia TaxID=51239 RepID=A0A835RQ70_VANPL|nr:hypothetical protein HPP92_000595 [Vanilla planifolia]
MKRRPAAQLHSCTRMVNGRRSSTITRKERFPRDPTRYTTNIHRLRIRLSATASVGELCPRDPIPLLTTFHHPHLLPHSPN